MVRVFQNPIINSKVFESDFLTFLEVISISLDIGNNPNKLYISEKLRSSSRRWCYFQGCSCYTKCTLATISMLTQNADSNQSCSIVRLKSDNLIRKRKQILIQHRSGNYSISNSHEVTSK